MPERGADDLPIHDTGAFQAGDEKEIIKQVEEFLAPPILEEIERDIFKTAPYVLDSRNQVPWTEFLYHLNHRLLPDEASTENQRWLATQCALALSGRVGEALILREPPSSVQTRPFDPHDQLTTQVSTPQDVITYYNWYKQGESEDFSLRHVLTASKRVLLSSYYAYRKEPSYTLRDQYQSQFASYGLLEQAVNLDSSPPASATQAPGK